MQWLEERDLTETAASCLSARACSCSLHWILKANIHVHTGHEWSWLFWGLSVGEKLMFEQRKVVLKYSCFSCRWILCNRFWNEKKYTSFRHSSCRSKEKGSIIEAEGTPPVSCCTQLHNTQVPTAWGLSLTAGAHSVERHRKLEVPKNATHLPPAAIYKWLNGVGKICPQFLWSSGGRYPTFFSQSSLVGGKGVWASHQPQWYWLESICFPFLLPYSPTSPEVSPQVIVYRYPLGEPELRQLCTLRQEVAWDRAPHENMSELHSKKNIEIALRKTGSRFWVEEQDEPLNMRIKLKILSLKSI